MSIRKYPCYLPKCDGCGDLAGEERTSKLARETAEAMGWMWTGGPAAYRSKCYCPRCWAKRQESSSAPAPFAWAR